MILRGCVSGVLPGCDLGNADLVGVQPEGARFARGVVCGPFPPKGGWGCAHSE